MSSISPFPLYSSRICSYHTALEWKVHLGRNKTWRPIDIWDCLHYPESSASGLTFTWNWVTNSQDFKVTASHCHPKQKSSSPGPLAEDSACWEVPTMSLSPGTVGFAKMNKKQSVSSRHLHFAMENKVHTKSDVNKVFHMLQPSPYCLPDICYIWTTPSAELASLTQAQRVRVQVFSQLYSQWPHLAY